MSDEQLQPDWNPDISEFIRWVKDKSVTGTLGPVPAVNHPFMPLPRLETYLKDGKRTRVLLQALFPNGDLPVEPEEVWRHCIKVFSILLLIGKGHFIQHFVQHEQLWDSKLPLLPTPSHFPLATGNNQFFEAFFKQQWHFCPFTFHHNEINTHLEKECILPIVHKEQLGDGGSALTYKIKLHPAYDDLTGPTDIRRDPSYRYANTYVLKTYRSKDAKEHYTSEVKAFKALMPGGSLGKSIIGFYGSYIQDGTYNILLEYADRRTLEHYLATTPSPTTGEDIYKIWSALFNLIKALKLIHDVQPIDPDDPPILQGWHQDIKPTNILVTSQKSGTSFDVEFKLADLGLSHFRKVRGLPGAASDKDTNGTREYGAPECYRFDVFTERSRLNVKQSVDIWSLGCVFSEVAVWVVHGKNGLEVYRQMRLDETKQLYDFKDGGCFHDGEKALLSVSNMHYTVFDNVRTSDHVTRSVIKKMVDEMLDEVAVRPTAIQLWSKSHKILVDAEKNLKSAKAEQPGPAGPSVRGERAQTDMQTRGRTPPEIPPGMPHSQSDDPARNSVPGRWSSLKQTKRSATVNIVPRGQTPSPEPNADDGYETPDETFNTISTPPTSPRGPQNAYPSQYRSSSNTTNNYQAASPEQSSETDDPARNRSPTSHGKARKRDSTKFDAPRLDQFPERSLQGSMSGLSIKNLSDPIPKHSPAEAALASQLHSDTLQSRAVQSPTAPTTVTSPPTKQPASRKLPDPLSIAEASKWILSKKQGQSFSALANKEYLNELNERDHVFLVDDAASMRPYWKDLDSVLYVLAYMLKGCDKDGLDLYFTVGLSKHNSKVASGLSQHIRGKALRSTSDAGSRLTTILHDYETKLRRHESKRFPDIFGKSRRVKPLNVYVLTDAVWQPQCDVAEPIRAMVETLRELRYPRKQVGIQFVQFGNDPKCAAKLARLDSGLNLAMDIVDAERADGDVWKMLLGAVNKMYDGDDNESNIPV